MILFFQFGYIVELSNLHKHILQLQYCDSKKRWIFFQVLNGLAHV